MTLFVSFGFRYRNVEVDFSTGPGLRPVLRALLIRRLRTRCARPEFLTLRCRSPMYAIHDRKALPHASCGGHSSGRPSLPLRRLRDIATHFPDLTFRFIVAPVETHGRHLDSCLTSGGCEKGSRIDPVRRETIRSDELDADSVGSMTARILSSKNQLQGKDGAGRTIHTV